MGRWASDAEQAVVTISSIMRQLIGTEPRQGHRVDGTLVRDDLQLKALLADILDGMGAKAGTIRARRRINLSSALCGSTGVSRLWWLLQLFGFPAPELQYPILTDTGLYFADFAWPEWRRIIELDRFDELEPSLTGDDVAEPLTRINSLRHQGWEVLHIRPQDLANHTRLVRRLQQFFPARAGVIPRLSRALL
ncbi:hypothetical protein EKN07_09555 [Actinobaculum sp. 352]|nr:hypothetical protein EKN07_09555 [Actinobaculum sp. 352]